MICILIQRPALHISYYLFTHEIKDIIKYSADDVPSPLCWPIVGFVCENWVKMQHFACKFSFHNFKPGEVIAVLTACKDKNLPVVDILPVECLCRELQFTWFIYEVPWSKTIQPLCKKPAKCIWPM